MFVILVYDVDESRVMKFFNLCKQYLTWRQRSVFEGNISKSKLDELLKNIKKLKTKEDYIIIYLLPNKNNLKCLELGKKELDPFIVI